jgi:hypothetical protein
VGYAAFTPGSGPAPDSKPRRETTRLQTPADVAPRQVPTLLRGNTPYVLAGIATIIIAIAVMLMRLGD